MHGLVQSRQVAGRSTDFRYNKLQHDLMVISASEVAGTNKPELKSERDNQNEEIWACTCGLAMQKTEVSELDYVNNFAVFISNIITTPT
jgi:hypothetical protein